MAKRTIKGVIDFLSKGLKDKGVNVTKIFVFGLYAYGKVTEDSDIEIIIVSNDFKGKDIFERARLTKDAEIITIKKFMVPLDIFTMTPDELKSGTSLISDYAKKGKVVYGS